MVTKTGDGEENRSRGAQDSAKQGPGIAHISRSAAQTILILYGFWFFFFFSAMSTRARSSSFWRCGLSFS